MANIRVRKLNFRGGPMAGEAFLVNTDLIAYAYADGPGCELVFSGVPQTLTKVKVTQTLAQLANDNSLTPPT